MTYHAALAQLNKTADQLKSRTLFDDILATVATVASLTDDDHIAEACVRDMMKTKYPGLQIVVPFCIDEDGDWFVEVRHFDGMVVAICHEA